MSDRTNKSPEYLIGHVAGIINEREIAINIGSDNGVEQGMIFKILSESPIDIIDPMTDEFLGNVDREKVRVKASEINNNFSICRTFLKKYVGNLPFGLIFEPRREIIETLKFEDSSIPKPLSEEESYVKIGDRVIQVFDED